MRAEAIPYRLIAHMRKGNLRETPIGVLLYSLALHERSVVVEIQRGRVKKAIMLEDGIAVDCRSNLLHETLAQFLVGKGRLTEFQRAECLAEAENRGVRIGKVLLDRGIIEAIDLYGALKQNLAYKLLECFTWTGGSFRVLSEFPENVSPLRLNVPQLVFTGITKFVLQEQVDGKVGILMGRQIALHPSPPIPLDAMRFSTAQRRTIRRLREQPQTEDLFAEGEMSNDELIRLLYALFLMGFVVPLNALPVEARSKTKVGKVAVSWEDDTETRSTESQSDPGVGGEPPSEGAAKDGSASGKDGLDDLFESLWLDDPLEGDRLEIDPLLDPIGAADALDDSGRTEPLIADGDPKSNDAGESARQRASLGEELKVLSNEIMSEYLCYRDKDPFDLFEVPIDASHAVIRDKYRDLCGRYAPARFDAPELQPIADKAEELLSATVRAYEDLKDEQKRSQLVAERQRVSEKRRQTRSDADFTKRSTKLGKDYCRQGYERLTTGNFGAASGLFSLAVGCDPEETSYRVDLAYSRFREAPENAEQSLVDLLDVVSLDLGCVQAYLYAAEIMHSLGELERAEEYFARACELWHEELRS